MGHTKENSATYLLVSNFKESMKLKSFVQYLGLDIKLSKSAVIEDGTHRDFNTPSVRFVCEPDMFVIDETNKVLILIENKVKDDRELEESQISEGGYLAIVKDYINNGYDAHLVFLVPTNYLYINDIKSLIKKNREIVHLITWDQFFNNFDNDRELEPIKRALKAIEIDGIDIEDDLLNRVVDFSLISPSIKINEDFAEYYIGNLIVDACDYSSNGRKALWKGDNVVKWQRPRRNEWVDTALGYTEYCDSPCIEILFQNDELFYMVAGYDYIQQRFCVYIQNYKNKKSIVEYCNDIQLPIGLVKSYDVLKSKYCEQLHDFIQSVQSKAKTNKELK